MQSSEVTTIMIADEMPPDAVTATPEPFCQPANDNGPNRPSPIDPRILVIARALGRLIARERSIRHGAANDNSDDDAQEDAK